MSTEKGLDEKDVVSPGDLLRISKSSVCRSNSEKGLSTGSFNAAPPSSDAFQHASGTTHDSGIRRIQSDVCLTPPLNPSVADGCRLVPESPVFTAAPVSYSSIGSSRPPPSGSRLVSKKSNPELDVIDVESGIQMEAQGFMETEHMIRNFLTERKTSTHLNLMEIDPEKVMEDADESATKRMSNPRNIFDNPDFAKEKIPERLGMSVFSSKKMQVS